MDATALAAAVAGLLGLAVGSFLNVVIYRVPRGESVISPPSRCPRCDEGIKNRHNVPVVGWLVLRGRCAHCRLPISVRYPLVEAASGVLFASVALRFGVTWQLPAYLYLTAVAIALAAIAVDGQRLPDSIVMPSYIVGIALLLPAGAVHDNWHDAARALAGLTLMVALLLAFTLAFPTGLGFGDVKLAGLLGLYLAWLSWNALLVGAMAALILAVGGRTAVVATHRLQFAVRSVPLAPCLAAAALLSVLIGTPATL